MRVPTRWVDVPCVRRDGPDRVRPGGGHTGARCPRREPSAEAQRPVRARRRPRPRGDAVPPADPGAHRGARHHLRRLLREQLALLPVAHHHAAGSVRPQHRGVDERRRQRRLRAGLSQRGRAGHRRHPSAPRGVHDVTRGQVPQRLSQRCRTRLRAAGLGPLGQRGLRQCVLRVRLRPEPGSALPRAPPPPPRLRDERVRRPHRPLHPGAVREHRPFFAYLPVYAPHQPAVPAPATSVASRGRPRLAPRASTRPTSATRRPSSATCPRSARSRPRPSTASTVAGSAPCKPSTAASPTSCTRCA